MRIRCFFGGLLLALSSVANAGFIGFGHDAAQGGQAVGDFYESAHGLVFTQAYFSNAHGLDWISGEPDSNYNGIINQSISGYFSGGVTDGLTAFIRYLDGGVITTLKVFDEFSTLIGTASSTTMAVSIDMDNIAAFELSWTNPVTSGSDDVIGIHGLSFELVSNVANVQQTTAVPTPGSLALLAFGLGALGLSRRRLSR